MADLLRDRLGLDTISTGNIIGFAMECFEKGLITARETAGPDLRFGNGEAMVRMVERIARRDTPIGGVLAEGHTRATQAIGKGGRALPTRRRAHLQPGALLQRTGGDQAQGRHAAAASAEGASARWSGPGRRMPPGAHARRVLRAQGLGQEDRGSDARETSEARLGEGSRDMEGTSR